MIIVGCKLISRKIPGAVIAVILSIILSNVLDASSHGVAVIGPVQGGLPPFGLPEGITLTDIPAVMGVALSCFFLIIAQSAATSRSFAMKHSQHVDINRDIVGARRCQLRGGPHRHIRRQRSPTKTEILDEQRGRSQMANITMALVVLIVVLFLTSYLTNMPVAVLAAIVFMIGLGLVDFKGLRRIRAARVSEFLIACFTAIVVFGWGVEQGIILAIILSIVELVRRAYAPTDFLVSVNKDGRPDIRSRDEGCPEPARAHRLPLRRATVLRQRQPVRGRHPEAHRRCPDTGALARARLLVDRRHRLLGQPQPRRPDQGAPRRPPGVRAGRRRSDPDEGPRGVSHARIVRQRPHLPDRGPCQAAFGETAKQ